MTAQPDSDAPSPPLEERAGERRSLAQPTPSPTATALRWSFSTLGCPDLSFSEACHLAADFHLHAIELRSLWGRVDLPACTAEKGCSAECAATLLQQLALKPIVAGSSFKLVGNDEKSRAELISYCEWADSWNIPCVRAFGGGSWGAPLSESDFAQAADTVAWWRKERRARGWRTELLLETHDAFSASPPCCELIRRLDSPLGIIWDSHHTWRLGGESPAETWVQLSPWIRHVHVKDSIDKPSARHPYTYVLPGDGQAPLASILSLLREHHFSGVVSLEWERLWHDYLPPLRAALVHLQSQPWFATPLPLPK